MFISAVPSQGGCSYLTNGTIECLLGNLGSDDSATITIDVWPTATGVITNQATVQGDEFEFDMVNNDAAVTTTVVNAIADIGVTKTDAPDPVEAGSNLVYTLVVTNFGPDIARGITLLDQLPFGIGYSAFGTTTGICLIATNRLVCDLGNFAPGDFAVVTVRVATIAAGWFTNTAWVMTTSDDTNLVNNSDREPTQITTAADDDFDGLPDWWETQHFGGPTNANPDADSDDDGATDREEFEADTNPRDPSDVFDIETIEHQSPTVLTFDTSPQRIYHVLSRTNLLYGDWLMIFSNLPGTGGELSIIDTNDEAVNFYRLNAEGP